MTTSVLNSSFFATGTEPATAGFSEITAASPSSVDGFAAVFEATTAISVTTDLTAPTINPATTPILSPVAFTSAPLEATEFSFAPLMTEDAPDAGSSSPSPLLPDSMGGDATTSPVVSAPKSVTSVELAASTAPAEIHEETPAVIPVTRESPRISNKKAVREETSSDDVSEDVADDTSPPESTESGLPSPLLQSVAPAFLPVPQIPIVLSIPIEVQPNAVVEGNETDTSVSTSALEAADDTTPRSNLGYSSERESPEAATYASLATSAESIPSSKKEKLSSAVSPRERIAPTRSAVDGTVKAVAGQPLATGVEPAPANRTARQPAQETMPVSASFETPVETVSLPARTAGMGTPEAAPVTKNRPATGVGLATPELALAGAEGRTARTEEAETEAVQSIQTQTASVASAERSVSDSGKNSPTATTEPEATRGVETPVQEKFAADLKLRRSPRSFEKQNLTVSDKKVTLDVEKEKVAEQSLPLGTEAAKEPVPMVHDIRQTRLLTLGGETLAVATGVSGGAGQGQAVAERRTETSQTAAANAVQVVRQISDAVDALAATERPGVNVRVKLDDVGVAVNVEYRNGEVRATFQTDSAELRDALATAWQTHAAAVTDSKPYRFAEPVFASSSSQTPGSQSSQSQSFSMGGDTSRQHQQQQPHSQSSVAELSPAFLSGGHQLRGAKAANLTPAAPVSTVGASLSSRLEAFA